MGLAGESALLKDWTGVQPICGVAWDAVPEPMVEYIDPGFYETA
jgi:hypothetical protein